MNRSVREDHFRSVWDQVWHSPDYERTLTERFTEDFRMHISSLPEPIARDAWIGFVGGWQRAFPDGRMDIQDLVITHDRLWVYWISSGTHSGEYLGVPASGERVKYWGMEIYRYSGDKIAECTAIPDALSLFRQLGAIKD
jgi:predicted ester cyclase